jgi:hypothetical protein
VSEMKLAHNRNDDHAHTAFQCFRAIVYEGYPYPLHAYMARVMLLDRDDYNHYVALNVYLYKRGYRNP